jgi:hypothetical protein
VRPEVLALIAAAAGGLGATAAVAVAGASPAPSANAAAATGSARVQGRFAVAGRVTAAKHVSGVHRGERFTRTWTLTSEGCRASSCPRLSLSARLGLGARAIERVKLSRFSPGKYRWRHTASSDTLCRTRHVSGAYHEASALYVTVSRRAEVNGVSYATALTATWSMSSGGCGATAMHSAATYLATVTSGVPAAALQTGSTTTGATTTGSSATGSVTSTDPMVTFPSSTGTTPSVTTISSTPSPTTPTSTNPHAPQPEAGG